MCSLSVRLSVREQTPSPVFSSYIVDIRSPGAFTSRPRCLSVTVVKSPPNRQDSSGRLSDGTVFLTFLPWRLFFDFEKWRSRMFVRFYFFFHWSFQTDGHSSLRTHVGISRTAELGPLNGYSRTIAFRLPVVLLYYSCSLAVRYDKKQKDAQFQEFETQNNSFLNSTAQQQGEFLELMMWVKSSQVWEGGT